MRLRSFVVKLLFVHHALATHSTVTYCCKSAERLGFLSVMDTHVQLQQKPAWPPTVISSVHRLLPTYSVAVILTNLHVVFVRGDKTVDICAKYRCIKLCIAGITVKIN